MRFYIKPFLPVLLVCICLFSGCIDDIKQDIISGVQAKIMQKINKRLNRDTALVNEYKNVVIIRSRIDTLIDKPERVWAESSTHNFFSDSVQQDKFTLKAIGDKDFKAKVFLTITNSKRKTIFKDSFPLIDVLGMAFEGGGYFATETKQEEFIKKYAANFFNKDRFTAKLVELENLTDTLQTDSVKQYYFINTFNYKCSKTVGYNLIYNQAENTLERKSMY